MKNTTYHHTNANTRIDASMMLSPHFSLREFIRSGEAIRHGIKNEPSTEQIEAMKALCTAVLEPLRRRYGAITISSGFRCQQLNTVVGGVDGSQHCQGEAADIFLPSEEMAKKYFNFIKTQVDFDQLIVEPYPNRRPSEPVAWLHVSYTRRRKNRKMILGSIAW